MASAESNRTSWTTQTSTPSTLDIASALPCSATPNPSPANRLRAQNTAVAAQISSDKYVAATQTPRPIRAGDSRRRRGGVDGCSGSPAVASVAVVDVAGALEPAPEVGAVAVTETSATPAGEIER